MKPVLSFVYHMLLSLILVSVGFVPASQALSAPLDGGAYSVAEQNVGQREQPRECPIDWKPSVLLPVSSHSEHFDVSNGAPGPLEVFYPSLGPFSDPFSDKGYTSVLKCGQYPLVIFLHGHCRGDLEKDSYLRWTHLPAALARSGYVVVVPQLSNIAGGSDPFAGDQDLHHAEAVLDWMQNGWEHHDHLARSPGPAVIGHSFGAILGARLATKIDVSAYMSLSAGWMQFDANQWQILGDLRVPSLFAWGSDATEANAQIDVVADVWDRIKTVKHKLVFEKGLHWDYLPPSDQPCKDEGKGKCGLVPSLAADYAALFLSRYVPTAGAVIQGLIPPSLTPPSVVRTALQDVFWSGHLDGLKCLPAAGERCKVTHSVEGPTDPWHFEDPTYPWLDRSGGEGAPNSATPPTVAVIPGLGVYNIAYRDTSGHLHELWRAAWGTGTTDLTDNAGAPKATGNPFAYVDTYRDTEILLYRDSGGTVRSLYWSLGDVGHDNLSGTAGAPSAAGDPVGYYDAATDTHHVIYRSSNGHLHELWWKGIQPVQYGGDLTALASAPAAVGQPSAFVGGGSTNIVIYRSGDGHIRSLYWTTGAVAHEDLSGYAGTPPAKGDPVAYYTAHNDTHQIVYVGDDWHVWELYWQGVAPVAGWNIMANLNAPLPASGLAAYYNAGTNTKHVFYNTTAFAPQLQEIQWAPGGGIRAHINLSVAYGTPAAWGQPAAFTVQAANTQHVTYRGTDNHIYEVILR